jgi:hypothetical protein
MRHEWVVRFDFGKVRPWVMRRADSPEIDAGAVISAIAGPDMVVLRGSRLPHAVGTRHEDGFDVSAGQRMTFTMTWFRSHHSAPAPLHPWARTKASDRPLPTGTNGPLDAITTAPIASPWCARCSSYGS